MADIDTLPNPDTLTRQPGAPSAGDVVTVDFDDQISPEEALAEARAQKDAAERDRDAARSREATAQRERDEALGRETQAGARALSAEERAIEGAISSQTTAVNQAKLAIVQAQATGDTVAAADAFEQLTEAKVALRDLGNRKAWLEQEKSRPAPQRQNADTVTVRTPAGEMSTSTSAKAWMDAHPRFYSDDAFYNHAVAAHSTVTGRGIKEGSPAYFDALSDHMQRYERFEAHERGDTKDVTMTTDTRPARPAPRMSAAATGAPVSRSSAPTNRAGAAPDANAIARRLGVDIGDLKEYARINGYTAQKYGGDETRAFGEYLKAHQEIAEVERTGGETGMRVDGAWR